MEGLGGALERGGDAGGDIGLDGGVNFGDGVTEGRAVGEVKGDGDGGELAEMLDGEGAEGGLGLGDCGEGDERAEDRAEVEGIEVLRLGLEGGEDFEEDAVLVGGGVDGGDLLGAVSVGESGFDLVGGDAEGGGAIALDFHKYLGVRDLEIGSDIDEAGDLAEAGFDARSGLVEEFEVWA